MSSVSSTLQSPFQRIKPFGFLLAFAVPLLLPLSMWLGIATGLINLMAWLPLFVLFVLLPSADYLIGRDTQNLSELEFDALDANPMYRVLTLLCLPVYVALLIYGAWQFQNAALSTSGLIGLVLSQGVIGGVVAINAAHELIHKANKLEAGAGGLLLACVGYGSFKIEHVRGHHVHVSTPLDASSARFGQNVYHFVSRSIPRNVAAAFRFEAERLTKLGKPALHWQNEALQLSAVTLGLALLFAWQFGLMGALFFLTQALVAIGTLEVINYVEHYGLERKQLASGRYERTTHKHSWNSSYLLTNWLLFQLQRHSDHHENPRRRYQTLRHFDGSPQLPGGYSSMFLLALVPPLWFRVINPRVPREN
jgi:alkane 1-monooxygenase